MLRGVKGGVFGTLEGCFAGDFGAAARCKRAVLPRNSAVFGLGEGAGWRFSARRTGAARLGEKFFKKGVKNLKIGAREGSEGGLGAPYIGCAR